MVTKWNRERVKDRGERDALGEDLYFLLFFFFSNQGKKEKKEVKRPPFYNTQTFFLSNPEIQ